MKIFMLTEKPSDEQFLGTSTLAIIIMVVTKPLFIHTN